MAKRGRSTSGNDMDTEFEMDYRRERSHVFATAFRTYNDGYDYFIANGVMLADVELAKRAASRFLESNPTVTAVVTDELVKMWKLGFEDAKAERPRQDYAQLNMMRGKL